MKGKDTMNSKFNHPMLRPVVLAGLLACAALGANAQQGGASSAGQAPAGAAMPGTTQAAPQNQHEHGARSMRQHRHDDASRAERRTQRLQIRVAQHLAALKVRLKLTPAQQGAWDTFTQAVQPTSDEIGHMMQARAQMRSLTTPERIDRMRALRTERDAAMDKRFDAAKTFYTQLSPEQQKTFDANAMRWGGGGEGKGKHGRQHGADHHGGWGMDRHHGGHDGDEDHDGMGPGMMPQGGERSGG